MIKVVLIRHFATEGNIIKRYIGRTDEPICDAGIKRMRNHKYPDVDAIFISPLMRCRQTAELIYPDRNFYVCEELKECDFGEFENKNYLELSGNKAYQDWINSYATEPFPGGEDLKLFKARTIVGFQNILKYCISQKLQNIALVVHGGTIMSILEYFGDVEHEYYHWHVDNGEGYIGVFDVKKGRIKDICIIS